ncbi:MAG: hypothetical protein J7K45_03805 [Thaumarchaeota archaeon]|nr:hypothetical protein [Nitrososphaerota archaeon]
MSLENIDRYIRELEAIKRYPQVKSERDSLLERNKKLESELASEKKRVEKLLKANKKLKDRVNAMGEEIENLKADLGAKEETIERLESRVSELEGLRATAEGKTLKEAEEEFLKAREREIRDAAERRFEQMKFGWEKSEKPKEVLEGAVKVLKHVLEVLSEPEPRHFSKEVADAGLPEKVEAMINSEVERRIDAEFQRRVEEESERKALEKLERLKSDEWPRWYSTYVEPRIQELESKFKSNAISALRGPWYVTCDKCGTRFQTELKAEDIESLLRTGNAWIECVNPNCVDLFRFFGRHRIKIQLRDLIKERLGHPPQVF